MANALAGDLGFCRSELSNNRKGLAQIQAERIVSSIDQGRAIYRVDKVADCLARLRGLDCMTARTFRELGCEEVIQPLIPIGEACPTSSHHECIDGYCATVVCATRKPDGQACYESQECASRYCSGGGSGGLCGSPIGRPDDLCAR
jgi:hypothetical protein